ncbi:MAG: hypothetical protein AAGJ92_07000 [Pseudomonadota bacterium]
MGLARDDHEIYRRRKARNYAVLIGALSFAALIFGVTIVKMQNGASMEGFDHQFRPSLLESTE